MVYIKQKWKLYRCCFWIFLLCCGIFITGCSADFTPPGIESTISTKNEKPEKVSLTEKEKELLSGNYANSEQVKEGILFSYQKEDLAMLRQGESYLQQKYPGYDFDILTFERANIFTPWAILRIQYKGSEVFKVFVTPKDGEYQITDTFYVYFLQPQYDAMVEKLLKDNGFSVTSWTTFPNAVGMELDSSVDISTFLDKMPNLSRDTQIFLFEEKNVVRVEEIEKVIREYNLYGSYTVYFVGEETDRDIDSLLSKRIQYSHVCFNNLDISKVR